MRIPAIIAVFFGAVAFLAGCASTPRDIEPQKAKLIDKLTLFVEAVQTDKYPEAFAYLTADERAKMMAPGGEVSAHVRRQLKALRLSTLAQKPGVRLVQGKVEGIYDQLPVIDTTEGQSQRGPEVPLLQ